MPQNTQLTLLGTIRYPSTLRHSATMSGKVKISLGLLLGTEAPVFIFFSTMSGVLNLLNNPCRFQHHIQNFCQTQLHVMIMVA